MAKLVAGMLAGLLLLLALIGAAVGGVASVFTGGGGSSSQPSQTALDDVPGDYLLLYIGAAQTCPGLDWAILAAIGKIESDHGRSSLPGIARGTVNVAGAGGSMQFLQDTFDSVIARHQIPPGGEDPPSRYNPHDAIHAAAFYLCDNGARDGRDLPGAIFAYNPSMAYRDAVLAQADTYRAAPVMAAPGELRTDWPPEHATMPDPTSGGRITLRTYTLVRALHERGMTGDGISCFGQRPANPNSDHPRGKACDVFFNPHDPEAVAEGWAVAAWLIANQARYGVRYLIWQGQYWSARDPRWVPYHSDAYGCPDPTNLVGCHYDHLHVSLFQESAMSHPMRDLHC